MSPPIPTISTQIHTHRSTNQASHAAAYPSPTKSNHSSPSQPHIFSLPSPHSHANPNSTTTPSVRHPLTRPLSPDLPTRDALYLFSNFSSYMRSPDDGPSGINTSEDFRDTVRLLDYARSLAAQPQYNVHVLHLKYRFQGPTQIFRSPYASGDYQLPLNYRDSTGRLRNPVPQPFSVLHDPVVKVDYHEDGVFEPLPGQAVFSHISRMCQPPPRIIVMSYVWSKVIQNHLASLSSWALTSSPPAYVFSPLETRLRESRPIQLALHHAIPMSMYAWPVDGKQAITPTGSAILAKERQVSGKTCTSHVDLAAGRRSSLPSDLLGQDNGKVAPMVRSNSNSDRRYPADPVASLSVVTADASPAACSTDTATVPPPTDRIPLWALAPGVGVLHGSTSASIGVRLDDFSALNLIASPSDEKKTTSTGMGTITSRAAGIKTSSIDMEPLRNPLPPVEAPDRPITPCRVVLPTAPTRPPPPKATHLSPPDARAPPSLSVAGRTQSWPAPVSKAPGWRKGRIWQFEDTLEELGAVGNMGLVVARARDLVFEDLDAVDRVADEARGI